MAGDQLHRELAVRMSLRAAGVRPAQKDEFEKVLELFDSPARASDIDSTDLWNPDALRAGLRKKGVVR